MNILQNFMENLNENTVENSAENVQEQKAESNRSALGERFEKLFFTTRSKIESVLEPIGRALPHPNVITGPIRVGLAVSGIAAHTYERLLGTILYALNNIGDGLDGLAARANNGERVTKEGEKFDPLVDKITVSIALINLSVQKIIAAGGTVDVSDGAFIAASAANIAVDAYSQASRGPIGEQVKDAYQAMVHPHDCTPIDATQTKRKNSANHWGKIKYGVQNVAILGAMVASTENEKVQIAATAALGVSAVLGYIGTKLRKTIS